MKIMRRRFISLAAVTAAGPVAVTGLGLAAGPAPHSPRLTAATLSAAAAAGQTPGSGAAGRILLVAVAVVAVGAFTVLQIMARSGHRRAGRPRPPGACRRLRLADPAAAVRGRCRPRRDAGRRSRCLRAVVEIRITARLRAGLRSWSQPRSRSRLRSPRAAARERPAGRAARMVVMKAAPGAVAGVGGLPKRHPACLRYLYR